MVVHQYSSTLVPLDISTSSASCLHPSKIVPPKQFIHTISLSYQLHLRTPSFIPHHPIIQFPLATKRILRVCSQISFESSCSCPSGHHFTRSHSQKLPRHRDAFEWSESLYHSCLCISKTGVIYSGSFVNKFN
jgi:hypothetical protein